MPRRRSPIRPRGRRKLRSRPRPADAPTEAAQAQRTGGRCSPHRRLATRELTDAELDRLAGTGRRHVEEADGHLFAFFTDDERHVVTAAKQAAVLRPHGHLLRSGSSLVPDEPSVCVTAWMDGSFCSHLTQGHVSLGFVLSHRRSYLGLNRAHGLRIFVSSAETGEPDWQLLGTPSAWSIGRSDCRWWYAHDGGLIQVTTTVAPESDECVVTLEVLDGPPCAVLAVANVSWLDAGGAIGTVTPEQDALSIRPPSDSATAKLYADPRLAVRWTPGGRDARRRRCAVRGRAISWPALGEPAFGGRFANCGWCSSRIWSTASRRRSPGTVTSGQTLTDAFHLEPPDTAAGQELAQIATMLPWFAHDALIHYLSPRGLEQYSGGAWGTRDVTQGPVGLLLALGAHDQLRELLLLVLAAQNDRGDWPQAFDFLARHRSPGQSEAHGDVVYWPLLALGTYLRTTGDHALMQERVPCMGMTARPMPSPSPSTSIGRSR